MGLQLGVQLKFNFTMKMERARQARQRQMVTATAWSALRWIHELMCAFFSFSPLKFPFKIHSEWVYNIWHICGLTIMVMPLIKRARGHTSCQFKISQIQILLTFQSFCVSAQGCVACDENDSCNVNYHETGCSMLKSVVLVLSSVVLVLSSAVLVLKLACHCS